jgi:hypothetical protein
MRICAIYVLKNEDRCRVSTTTLSFKPENNQSLDQPELRCSKLSFLFLCFKVSHKRASYEQQK